MQKKDTQQFAKFFIKDLKLKSLKFKSDKSEAIEFNTSPAN